MITRIIWFVAKTGVSWFCQITVLNISRTLLSWTVDVIMLWEHNYHSAGYCKTLLTSQFRSTSLWLLAVTRKKSVINSDILITWYFSVASGYAAAILQNMPPTWMVRSGEPDALLFLSSTYKVAVWVILSSVQQRFAALGQFVVYWNSQKINNQTNYMPSFPSVVCVCKRCPMCLEKAHVVCLPLFPGAGFDVYSLQAS